MEAGIQGVEFLAFLNGVEIVWLLAAILVLFGARFLDGAGRRFTFVPRSRLDEEAEEAGRSVGGIAGAPGFQPITAENEVAEIYDPGAIRDPVRERLNRFWRRAVQLRDWMRKIFERIGMMMGQKRRVRFF